MIRVLVLTPSYPAPDNPEGGIFVHRQVVGLATQGLECRVVHYRAAPPRLPSGLLRRSFYRHQLLRLGSDRVVEGIPVRTVLFEAPGSEEADLVPVAAEALGRTLASEAGRVDVVYAQWLWHAGAAALLLRERFGWPAAAIARGSDLHQWLEKRPGARPWVERVLREADLLLANCEALRRRALGMRREAAVELVYNGCDATRFRPAARREEIRRRLGFRPDDRILVFCGSLEARKGIAELTEAWRRFAPRHPAWRLVAIGSVADRTLARELSRGPRVRLMGRAPEAAVAAFLQAGDAYVQPSRAEGLSNATMEAMATALPVVTCDADGQRELVEDGRTGWLVPPEDPAALAAALDVVAGEPEDARRRGLAARRAIEERFRPEPHWRRLASLLRETAARGGVPAGPRA